MADLLEFPEAIVATWGVGLPGEAEMWSLKPRCIHP